MKKKTKGILIGAAVILVLGALGGGSNQEATEQRNAEHQDKVEAMQEEAANKNILLETKLKEADVMNGAGDTVLGQRAYIEIKKDELIALTQEQFQEFVDEVVKDSDYNYVTIIAEDASKAIFFPGSMVEIAHYGVVNIDGTLKATHGYITLQEDGTYKYESN